MVLVSVRAFYRHGLKSGRDSSHASGSNDKPRPLTGRALKYKLFVQIAEDETNGAIVAEAAGWMFELRLEGYAMPCTLRLRRRRWHAARNHHVAIKQQQSCLSAIHEGKRGDCTKINTPVHRQGVFGITEYSADDCTKLGTELDAEDSDSQRNISR